MSTTIQFLNLNGGDTLENVIEIYGPHYSETFTVNLSSFTINTDMNVLISAVNRELQASWEQTGAPHSYTHPEGLIFECQVQ